MEQILPLEYTFGGLKNMLAISFIGADCKR